MKRRIDSRRRLLRWVGALLVAVCGVSVASDYTIAPTPTWVHPVERGLPDAASRDTANGGVQYLLADTQVDASRQPRGYYFRVASMAINEAGVDSIANISVDFNPAHETLTLHALQVIRDGNTIDRLASTPVRILQREAGLEARMFDGSRTASLVISDVRVGDIVDYAYSVDGENPVFAGKVSNTTSLQFGVPVARIHRRLLAPTALPLQLAAENTEHSPKVSEIGAVRQYVWDLRNVPAVRSDADTPRWHSGTAKVRWSEYRSWREVVEWALPLYSRPADPGPAVRVEIERIAKAHTRPEDRLRAVLDFVQREVRYFGFELGVGSHVPSPPSLVLERRFGDCKDKTMLAIAMLDALGVEAKAALVDTSTQRAVRDRLPTPKAFNHMLVHARVGERTYWLDPTLSPQVGDLDHIVQPDHGYALLVDPGSRDLVSMANASTARRKRVANLAFDASRGFAQSVGLSVTTTLDGAEAEELRSSLATVSRADVQRNYLNFYARHYPSIVVAAPIEIEDDAKANRIVTRETYRIESMAHWDADMRRHTADIVAPDIDVYLKVPTTVVRTAPLALAHPVDVAVTTEILLDDGWNIEPSSARVDDPAFKFEREVSVRDNRVRIEDRFRSLTDVIAADEVARYSANIGKALDETSYQLYWRDESSIAENGSKGLKRYNYVLILAVLMALVVGLWFARIVYRYDPVVPMRGRARELSGIGGWLIWPMLGLLITPYFFVRELIDGRSMFLADQWWLLTSPHSDSFHALWAPGLVFSYVSNAVLLVFSLLLNVLFFKRRSSLPRLYIAVMLGNLVVVSIDAALLLLVQPESYSSPVAAFDTSIRQLFGVLLWGAYFLRSDRVGATFVVRLDGSEAGAPPARIEPTVPAAEVRSTPDDALDAPLPG